MACSTEAALPAAPLAAAPAVTEAHLLGTAAGQLGTAAGGGFDALIVLLPCVAWLTAPEAAALLLMPAAWRRATADWQAVDVASC